MAKYRKLPVKIEAVQWINGKLSEVTPWISEALNKDPIEVGAIIRMGDDVFISTLEGEMKASDGDYILRGVKGEIYPCKPDIFKETYMLIGEIKRGDIIGIKNNLMSELVRLGFNKEEMESFVDRFQGTIQTAVDVYTSQEHEAEEKFVTVEMCCEIPLACCDLLKRPYKEPVKSVSKKDVGDLLDDVCNK